MGRYLYFILFAFLLLLSNESTAQIGICNQVLSASGKSTTLGGRSYTYTIGEPVILTLSANSHKITQGFNQPDLCLSVLTHDLDLADWKLEVYPNPASEQIHIRYTAEKEGRLVAHVYDLFGRLIAQNIALDSPNDTVLDCQTWQAGIYMIQIQDLQSQSKATVRIVHL